VSLQLLADPEHAVALLADGEGNWTKDGNPVDALKGCLDIDISVTPFTNTLPIRRLNLHSGDTTVIEVAYLVVPDCEIWKTSQRYTCLDQKVHGGLFRFQGLATGFEAEISADEEGFVVDYPPVFRRILKR
jgi:hypothetical protein